MSKDCVANAVVALVTLLALLCAGVLATAPVDAAVAAVGASADAACGGTAPQPTKGPLQWNS